MENNKYYWFNNNLKSNLSNGLFLALVLQTIAFVVFKNFSYYVNPNFIFGIIGSGNNVFAVAISLIILVAIIITARNIKSPSIALITGGLVSNIADRIIYGGVIDYIYFETVLKFNIADILIIVGTILLGIKILRTT